MEEQKVHLPNNVEIHKDFTFMTARWNELTEPAKIEVRAFKEDYAPQNAWFTPDRIDEATDWAENMNERGYNIYAVRNPIKMSTTKNATDDDIIASFFLWADCDEPHAASNVQRFTGPKWSAAVITGTVPSVRAHTYWMLQTPCYDLAQWRNMQIRIAKHFQSDRSVINPSRIMRVGGTVSYPFKKKIKKGYAKELTKLRTEYDEERPPVTLDQMGRVFKDTDPATDGTLATDWIEGHDRKTQEDYASILERARTDGEKHTGVRDLCATLAGQGVNIDMAAAIVRTACPVWDDNVEKLLTSAYDKFYAPKDADKGPEPVPATPQAIVDFKIDSSADFLADLEPLEYLIDGILPKGVAYSLTGHAGHGKTTLALQFALAIAEGSSFANRDTSKGSVLILAGENPYNVKWQYAAALAAQNINPDNIDINFVQGRFSIKEWSDVLKAKLAAMPDLKLIIVDSLQAFFEGDNDNDNMQMVEMAHKLRKMCDTPQRPSILIIAHPAGKVASKDNLVPRGGGAFLNEIDGNLTVWSEDASQQTLHHSPKFRGAGFDPIEWVMQIHEFSHLTDIHGTPLKLPVSRPEMTTERSRREEVTDTLLRDYLLTVEAGAALSIREAAAQFRVSKWKMGRIIEIAKEEKLMKRYARSYKITEGGKEFLSLN